MKECEMEMFTGNDGVIRNAATGVALERKPLGRPPGSFTGVGYGWEPKNEKPLHDAVVDQLIATPQLNAVQLGSMFGYSAGAMRMMLRSDLLREKLASRREDLVDPLLKTSLEDRFAAMLEISLERATQIIATTGDGDLALKGVDVAARAMGFGARVNGGGNTTQMVVINPGVAPNSASWAAAYGPLARGGVVQDLDVREPADAGVNSMAAVAAVNPMSNAAVSPMTEAAVAAVEPDVIVVGD